MTHTIADPSKMTVHEIKTTSEAANADLQTFLRTLAASDDVVSINYMRNKNSNRIVINVTYEDQ
jgi:hypothetical protein|tara:strand:- start:616 stop:807 length:192 start_codon:yes stop_codon:yes gene_type:complete